MSHHNRINQNHKYGTDPDQAIHWPKGPVAGLSKPEGLEVPSTYSTRVEGHRPIVQVTDADERYE